MTSRGWEIVETYQEAITGWPGLEKLTDNLTKCALWFSFEEISDYGSP